MPIKGSRRGVGVSHPCAERDMPLELLQAVHGMINHGSPAPGSTSFGGVSTSVHATTAGSSTGSMAVTDAALDECISTYTQARQACFTVSGSSCEACVGVLDVVSSECLQSASSWFETPRGQHFINTFRDFRFLDVGMQCLDATSLPTFNVLTDTACGVEKVRRSAASGCPSLEPRAGRRPTGASP